jgi:hypothetical protein
VNAGLPPQAREEWDRLTGRNVHPIQAWTQGPWDTEFRAQMLPYHDQDHAAFRVVVPVSGGLDSATCHRMAVFAGLPVEAAMVDTGIPYAAHDWQAARTVTGDAITLLDLPRPTWTTIDEFQVGRNGAIVWRLCEWMRDHQWWGEIWLGNLGGNYLETPIVGGDKSFRWMATMQQLMVAAGFDIRLASPLGGMSKSDLVAWWAGRRALPLALATRSCFADIPAQCGRCWACLYRYVAFAARGYGADIETTYPHGIDFTGPAAEFRRRAAFDLVTTHPSRMVEVCDVLDALGLGGESTRPG